MIQRKQTRTRRRGFSLIEVIAAVVILAVVATATVATISPLREKSRAKIDQQNIAKLNGTVQAFYMERGSYPDRYMTQLQTYGYAASRLHTTPYGGYYEFDSNTLSVINPQAPATPL